MILKIDIYTAELIAMLNTMNPDKTEPEWMLALWTHMGTTCGATLTRIPIVEENNPAEAPELTVPAVPKPDGNEY